MSKTIVLNDGDSFRELEQDVGRYPQSILSNKREPVKNLTPSYLLTPYFQTRSGNITEFCYNKRDFGNSIQFNYRPYNLFCLKTRLEPLSHKVLDPELFIHFNQRYMDSKMRVIVEFWKGAIPYQLTPQMKKYMQEALDAIVAYQPDMCLLLADNSTWNITISGGSKRVELPKWWVNQTMRYLNFTYHAHAQYLLPNRFQVGGMYVNLSRFDVYTSYYHEMLFNGIQRLTDMYKLGYIIAPLTIDRQRMARWKVSSLIDATQTSHHKTIFYPEWSDSRLTEPVGGAVHFMIKHIIQESDWVWLKSGSGAEDRYQIAATFMDFGIPSTRYRFFQDIVEVQVDSLMEAQVMAGLVNEARSRPVESLITMQYPDIGWYNINLILLRSMTEQQKLELGLVGMTIRGYQIKDQAYQYCISVEVPIESNPTYYYNVMVEWLHERLVDRSDVQLAERVQAPIELKPVTGPVVSPVVSPRSFIEPIKPHVNIIDKLRQQVRIQPMVSPTLMRQMLGIGGPSLAGPSAIAA